MNESELAALVQAADRSGPMPYLAMDTLHKLADEVRRLRAAALEMRERCAKRLEYRSRMYEEDMEMESDVVCEVLKQEAAAIRGIEP